MSEDSELQRIYDTFYLVQERRAAPATERQAWIDASRLIFAPGERRPCWVCGKFKSITHAHHVVPLTTQYDRGFKYPDQEYLWLCPSHHVIAHIFIQNDNRSMTKAAFMARDRTMIAVMADLSDDEVEKMFEIMRLAGRSPS